MMKIWLAGVFLFISFAGISRAQDTRVVSEPKIRPTCAILISNKNNPNTGLENDQVIIQNALNQCPAGHAVHLSPSNQNIAFISGPLIIKSGVSLVIDKGATLFASTDPKLYDKGSNTCGTTDHRGHGCRAFITVQNAKSSSIMGQGVINGQGNELILGARETWWELARRAQKENTEHNVPRLIEVMHSNDFSLYQITLINSPNFHVTLNAVDGFTAWGIRIDSPMHARNTDGIDPISSRNITITKSHIRTGDDSIAIKAGRQGVSENISIIDNHFYNGHGMSIGSETISGVRNVLVDRLSLEGGTAGIRIKSDISRGGPVERIHYSNICMRNVQNTIELTQVYNPHATGNLIPNFSNIVIESVFSLTPGRLISKGLPNQSPIQVKFQDVKIAGHENSILQNTPELQGIEFDASVNELRERCKDAWTPFPKYSLPSSRPQLSDAQAQIFSQHEVFKYAGLPGREVVSPWEPQISAPEHPHYLVNPKIDKEDSTHFKTIQAAIDQLVRDVKSKQLTERQFIGVHPAVYTEVVYVPELGAPISIQGMGQNAKETIISFNLDASVSGSEYAHRVGHEFQSSDAAVLAMFDEVRTRENITTFGSATLWTKNKGFQLNNLTVENSYVREVAPCTSDCTGLAQTVMHQAVALMVDGADQSVFSDVRLLGLQDTLYLKSQKDHSTARSYFAHAYIEGDVDFIFGDATAFFYNTEIKSLGSRKDSYVGAPSTNVLSKYGFVFDHCQFTSDNSPNAQLGVYRLARQWFHNQKCTPYGGLALESYSCQLGKTDNYSMPHGEITFNTLKNVGKMIVMNSTIGSHINKSHPWADWNTLGKISYRPAQHSIHEYIENLKAIGFSELIPSLQIEEVNMPDQFLSEYKNIIH